MQKINLRDLTCQYPLHIRPDATDFYQLHVVEISQNTCKPRDKMLQLKQNHSNSHYTD